MFISAFILVICFAAMVQFAVFSWRAGLLRTIATEPAGEQAEMTAAISHNIMNERTSRTYPVCKAFART